MSPIGSVNGASVAATPAPPPSGGLVPNQYAGAFERYVPMPGFLRIDLEVVGGDAYLQISEYLDRQWDDPTGAEMLLREGSHSIPLVRPAFGWRVRSASSSAGVSINVRTFG